MKMIINTRPTWSNVVVDMLVAYGNAKPAQQAELITEFQRMAAAADRYNAEVIL